MVISCSAPECRNRGTKMGENRITFHSFPKDDVLLKKWIIAMKRDNWTPKTHSRICSQHFTPDCYETSGWSSIPRLKLDAIPSIFQFSELFQKTEEYVHASCIKKEYETVEVLDFPSNNYEQKENSPEIENIIQKKPRLCYLGDFKKLSAEAATLDFSIYSNLTEKIIERKNKQIKLLQQRNRRLNKQLIRLKSLVTDLLEKNLVTDEIAQSIVEW